jgi:hypothetical protein
LKYFSIGSLFKAGNNIIFLHLSGRNQVISEFKALVSSLPREMGAVQSELSKHKDASLQLHSLRAEVHSLSSIRTRKVSSILLVCTISGQVELIC